MLLLVVVNLLLCLIYKLNVIIGVRVLEKNMVYIGFGSMYSFRHPLWVLERVPSG